MKHLVRTRIICSVLAIVSAGALFASCAKKEGPVRAVAAFVVGTVTVERAGSPARPLKHKEEVMRGDVVRTGDGSMLVIQLGRDSVIKIESDTVVSMNSIMGKEGTRINLEEGRVLSRLRHLSKGTDFRIITKTAIAAVRGTEFSVSYGTKESVVAVNDGTVEVKKAAAGKETGEGTAVEVGKAAVVDRTISTRPVSDAEQKDFNRFRKIVPIEDLDGTSEADLKKMEDDLMKDREGGAEIDRKDDSSAGKDTSAVNDAAKNVVLWTGKSVYSSPETVVVYYKNMPDYRNCWIDVSRASDGDGRYRSYYWTYSVKTGKMEFSGLRLEPGIYEVRAHFSKSNSVEKRFRFQVR
jgi:hypothetical protein